MMKLSITEKNRLANVYRREADQHGIGSPYRIDEYIQYRLRGLTQGQALAKTKKVRLGGEC